MCWTSQLGRTGLRDAPMIAPPLRRRYPRARLSAAVVQRRHRSPAEQVGFSLIEVLVAVALVSIVVIGLVGGFLTLVRTNAATQEQQTVDHAVTNYAESLKAATYLPCTPTGPPPAYGGLSGLWSSQVGVALNVIKVEYWNSSTKTYRSSCPGTDAGTQRLTVRAEWRDSERQAQIVKRNR